VNQPLHCKSPLGYVTSLNQISISDSNLWN